MTKKIYSVNDGRTYAARLAIEMIREMTEAEPIEDAIRHLAVALEEELQAAIKEAEAPVLFPELGGDVHGEEGAQDELKEFLGDFLNEKEWEGRVFDSELQYLEAGQNVQTGVSIAMGKTSENEYEISVSMPPDTKKDDAYQMLWLIDGIVIEGVENVRMMVRRGEGFEPAPVFESDDPANGN